MENIYIKKASKADFKNFYSFKCESNNIYWTNYTNKPIESNLFIWFITQLDNFDRDIFIAYKSSSNAAVGYGYIDKSKDYENSYEISYAISTIYSGNGYGTNLVKLLVNYSLTNLKATLIYAWVFDSNIKSLKCLIKNNFIETSQNKEINFLPTNSKETMTKYILKP